MDGSNRRTRWEAKADLLPPPPPIASASHPAEALKAAPKAKPAADFGLSGVLADESNMKNGVVQKYQEPDDASKPTKRWRLYVFKGGTPDVAPRLRLTPNCCLIAYLSVTNV